MTSDHVPYEYCCIEHYPFKLPTWTDEQLQHHLVLWQQQRDKHERIYIRTIRYWSNLPPELEYKRYALEYQGATIFLTQAQYDRINAFIEQGHVQDDVHDEPTQHHEEDSTLARIKSSVSLRPSISGGEASTYVLLKILDVLERLEKKLTSSIY